MKKRKKKKDTLALESNIKTIKTSAEKDNSGYHAKGRREYHRCTVSNQRERRQGCELSLLGIGFPVGRDEREELGSQEETERIARTSSSKKRSTFLEPTLYEPREPGLEMVDITESTQEG